MSDPSKIGLFDELAEELVDELPADRRRAIALKFLALANKLLSAPPPQPSQAATLERFEKLELELRHLSKGERRRIVCERMKLSRPTYFRMLKKQRDLQSSLKVSPETHSA